MREGPWRRRPPAREADQFWPQSAVDASNGTVWVCFYDTLGDPARKRAFYSCTISRNGGRTWRRRYGRPPCRRTRRCPAPSATTAITRASPPSGGVAHPIWTDTRELADFSEEIYTTSLRETDVSP